MSRVGQAERPPSITSSPGAPSRAAPSEAPEAGPALQPDVAPPARSFEKIAAGATRPAAGVDFRPAKSFPYECTIHTLQMKGDDGRAYNVVLDLIRSDKNELWAINQDRTALRAVVSDAQTGEVIASKFVDFPRDDFDQQVGALESMDDRGHIGFKSAGGDMAFDLSVQIEKSTLAQDAADGLKAKLEKAIAHLPPDLQEKVRKRFPLQLLVTDYPKTHHTGSLTLDLPGRERPLRLTADHTPSTVSHHYGSSLTDYVFLASVPQEGKPRFIAVITREQVDLDPRKPGGEASFPFGYLIRTDASGKSELSLLRVDADPGRRPGELDIGSDFLGTSLDVRVKHEAGSVTLNDGHLPSRTAFGEVTIKDGGLLRLLGLGHEETYPDVVVDITGSFLEETGRAPEPDHGSSTGL